MTDINTRPSQYGNQKPLRLGVVGSSAGNGHPYSWSAILNGYDRERMTNECPFPGIPQYLNQQSATEFPHPSARVTHIYSQGDGGFSAEHVAACSLIPHVVGHPEDLIGKVDAVVVATDRASEHVDRCRPFVEANMPVLVDKPLALEPADLQVFIDWVKSGAPIMSSSSMRYATEFLPFHGGAPAIGEIRYISVTAPKSWDTYAIHALEAIYPILGPGFQTATNIGSIDRDIVRLTHKSGADVIIAVRSDMIGGLASVQLVGTRASAELKFNDSFTSFKNQLEAFITYVQTRVRPYPFDETVELMRLLMAGRMSREHQGATVSINDIVYPGKSAN